MAAAVTARIWSLVALGVACAAVAGVALCWPHSHRSVIVAPIADGQPATTALVYEPQLVVLSMLLATLAGVLAVVGVAGLLRRRKRP